MALFDEASPICRGKNLSWETVLLFFNNMPREAMPKAKFNSYVEARINAWTQTHSQIARQLAFYYEENGVCYPRFTEKTSLQDLFAYMQNWAAKYFIPNPYAPSLKGKVPICIYSFILKSIKDGQTDFDDILDSIFHVKLSSHDKVNVYLSYFTNLLIDNNHQVSINEKLGFVDSELYPAEEYATDAKKYYDYFTLPSNEVFDSNRIITINKSLQQIYYGTPGTGKSHEIKRLTKGKEVIRTTFHPDSDYSTFVGAYKPTTKSVPIYSTYGEKAVEVKDADGKPMTEDRIVYEFVEQAFLQAYIKAWKQFAKADEGKAAEEVYLVIEEINRGNCAQIFGDLFQLLDRGEDGFSEYPIVADKDLQKQLAKAFADMPFLNAPSVCGMSAEEVAVRIRKGEILLLPNNLYIWATMNTSDQSLFPIDSAFKRRWDWQYMPIANGNRGWRISANGNEYDWWEFLEKINALIGEKTSSEDKKLGYYFCKAKDGVIDAKMFVGKVIFYLWNDVFKDYEFEGDAFNDVEGKLTFDKFYKTVDGTTSVLEEKVALFLKNLEVKIVKEDIVDDEADDVPIDGNGVSKHKSLRSVKFRDGTLFSTEEMSHFDVYLESLKKIGLERVQPIVANMKYRRKNCPMISLEEMPGIVNSNFKYHKEGDYYIVKGAIDDTLINILNELNSQLNIGYIVSYE